MRWCASWNRFEGLRTSVVALLSMVAFTLPAHAAIEDAKARSIITAAIGDFVRPAYADFARSTQELSESVGALCAQPSQSSLDDARARFIDAVGAWSQAEVIRFGPITAENRQERILFWPDRRGIGLKQVQAILASKDETATDRASLATKSVAAQGLGALEFVLFGTDAETLTGADGTFRCRYAAAIAANLDGIADDLSTAWQDTDGISWLWSRFGPDNDRYRNSAEALGELVDVVVHGLEQVRDVRLNGFLGTKPEADKPKSAIYWRSGQTVTSLAGNLSAMRRLMDVSGIDGLVSSEGEWIPDAVDYEFANAQAITGPLRDEPIDRLLQDPAERGSLEFLRIATSSLSGLVGQRLTGDIGLTVGFSSLDGD
ncbi:peptidase M75, Imelysin [Tianweitania sp. BSSL-BM11]|uniref:Peptidase M75, Imelysin n=1 Tax=Tianweitania aestuarii TaxID=2814886 RepID=A0ABS5RQ24_9HYPH|nr:imelysin family protein [Tianweitania aestuarii]MBS9719136.1 peptidase M75, Imelysin [Tianweitania aestuarii]